MTTKPPEVSLQDVQIVWGDVASSKNVNDPNTQVLLGGVNVRLNALQALKAIYLTTKLYMQGKLSLATGHLGPQEIASLGKKVFDLIVTTLDALREPLRESSYAACVVLAGNPEGLTPEELERELKVFVEGLDATKLPFYMGFTESFLLDCQKQIESPGALETIINDLKKGKWVTESNNRLLFQERHFVWGTPTLS